MPKIQWDFPSLPDTAAATTMAMTAMTEDSKGNKSSSPTTYHSHTYLHLCKYNFERQSTVFGYYMVTSCQDAPGMNGAIHCVML